MEGDNLQDMWEVEFSSGDGQETTWYLPEDQGTSSSVPYNKNTSQCDQIIRPGKFY